MTKDVLLAVILGAHGLKGEVRVKTFTEAPQALARYRQLHARDGRVFTVAELRPAKADEAVVSLAEVSGRTAAEDLKGLELFVARDVLPAPDVNEYYHADLVGLTAMDEEDRTIGTVKAIHNYGAGDVIEILRDDGDSVMLPFARDFVPLIDVANARIVVAVPEDAEAGEKGNVE
jgi:16S rRNA processing protein RimM